MLKTTDLFDLKHTLADDYLRRFEYPYLALKGISAMISALGKTLSDDYAEISPEIWVHKSAKIAPTAHLG